MPDVFLSYRSDDRDLIAPFAEQMAGLGLDVWFDQKIRVGERWDGVIDQHLTTARSVIVFWTQRSVQSGWVIFEAVTAQQRNVLIPVYLENCEAPGPLAFLQGARLNGWQGQPDHQGWQKLLAETERLLQRNDLLAQERARAETERRKFESAAREKDTTHHTRPMGHFRAEKLNRKRRRILSIDGAGPRALVSLQFLKRIESLLRGRSKDPDAFVLSDYFDLIGGTSVGGLMAAGLALGMRVAEVEAVLSAALLNWYAPHGRLLHRFSTRKLDASIMQTIMSIAGDRKLSSDDLKTGFAACTKRLDTESTWVVTNNPLDRYWKSGPRYVGNEHYLLREILRGCIAYPGRPEPCMVELQGDPGFAPFVDGTMGDLADPSYHLLMTATLPPYGLNWQTGADQLLLISVGSGLSRQLAKSEVDPILRGLIKDTIIKNVMTMQTLGISRDPWRINSQLDDMKDCLLPTKPLFLYKKYDVLIEKDYLRSMFAMALTDAQLNALRSGTETDADHQRLGASVGENAAARSVQDEDFPVLFDTRFEE